MNIYEAVQAMKKGEKITKSNWGNETYIRLYNPYDDNAYSVKEHEPIDGTLIGWIYMRNQAGCFIPWTVTQGDLFCSNFQIYKPKK